MVYITTPAIPSCLVAFLFSDPYSPFKIFNFYSSNLCTFINPVMDLFYIIVVNTYYSNLHYISGCQVQFELSDTLDCIIRVFT